MEKSNCKYQEVTEHRVKLLQAALEGKEIQYKDLSTDWTPVGDIYAALRDFPDYRLRIKPEPRIFTIAKYKDIHKHGWKDWFVLAPDYEGPTDHLDIIKVQEIL